MTQYFYTLKFVYFNYQKIERAKGGGETTFWGKQSSPRLLLALSLFTFFYALRNIETSNLVFFVKKTFDL